MTGFSVDPFPGKPKLLFIGLAESTHTRAWIDLLQDAELNVRLFALTSGLPPDDWPTRTYVTAYAPRTLDRGTRSRLYAGNRPGWFAKRGAAYVARGTTHDLEERWLAQILREWQPDIVHTLGLDPAGYFYDRVRKHYAGLAGCIWIATVRGGPDLALRRLLPEYKPRIQSVLQNCQQLIADNAQNYQYAVELGLTSDRVATLGVVPGTGGVDVASLAQKRGLPPSRSRLILYPKAYESPQSKALPVFEAIRLAWDRIQPCEIIMTATTPETRMWYQTLPEPIRTNSRVEDRLPRSGIFELLARSRLMLAPSLADGIPNSLYEAMACGAFPILSPLDTIQSVVVAEQNVLFARNLFPEEIANTLCRAMTDNDLVDSAAQRNLVLVRNLADRALIGPRVIAFYQKLVAEHTHV
jgi:glycosyltransferase involved in cell wall biosynthesis